MAIRRIGVLTGGGDVPGLNACIRSVVLNADERGWEVVGLRRGWAGVLAMDPADPESVAANTMALDRAAVRGIDRRGGTMLHTSRADPRTTPDGDRTAHVLRVLEHLGIDGLVTLGGDGTLRFSAHLAALGVPVASVPKTMDNDVFGTDYCIGFSTAVTRSVEAIGRLRTTIESHERVGVIELFGRRSGETALLSGFLAQVDRTAISEVPVDPAALVPLLLADRADNPANAAVMVISEGAKLVGEEDADVSAPGTSRDTVGVATRLARVIEREGGVGTVVQELAYLMRAGTPDALDRMVGFAFGDLAVRLLAEGAHGRMVALREGRYADVPADTLLTDTKRVDVAALYDPARYRPRLRDVRGLPMFLY
jgi:6-phosphofructokinase 1